MTKIADSKFIVENVNDFNLTHTFECGQCFRWDKTADGSFVGVAHDRVIGLEIIDNSLIISNTSQKDFDLIWKNYFDLDCDYSKIKKCLSKDETVKKAISYGGGIRILNQDLWECIISFIISANNNIPRIKGIINRFCEIFGKKVSFMGKDYYTFPTPQDLEGITLDDLAVLRAGFRDKYIIDAISKVLSGEVCLDKIKNSTLADAKAELLKIKGIGNKVSDCILLFGAGRKETFPVDVWVKRVISNLYSEETCGRDIYEFAKEKFGEHAGVAQQYLFYYMRENFRK